MPVVRPATSIIVIMLLLSMAGHVMQAQASDTESEPFMIYVDPETGKYTTTKPDKTPLPGTSTTGNQPTPLQTLRPETTPWLPAAMGSIGLLLCCYLLALLQTRAHSPEGSCRGR